jgi:hypothetical protein
MKGLKLVASVAVALCVIVGSANGAKTIVSAITLKHGGSQTYPQTEGINVTGAKSLIVYIDWTTWTAGGVSIQPIFAQSKTDSGASYYSCTWLDTISLSSPYASGAAGSFSVRLVDDGIYPAGFMFLRLRPWANANITGFTAKVELAY